MFIIGVTQLRGSELGMFCTSVTGSKPIRVVALDGS